jgi:broad specificity phosphatase PhoE
MDETPRYWFAAKLFGWGWGLPLTWEGWVVYGVWLVGFIALLRHFAVPQHPLRILIITIGTLIPLTAICYWKGEPLRPPWRNR